MPYSAQFAERAKHYREIALRTPNGWQAKCQLGLANLFLEMSCDMRLRELTGESTVQRASDRFSHPMTFQRKSLNKIELFFAG
jgi:hypothetical protein